MTTIKRATLNINRKELAFDLGVSEKTVGDHINGAPKFSLVELVAIWSEHAGNDIIVNKICADQGGFFYREMKQQGNNFKGAAQILKEFGEFMTVMAEGYLDGKVTRGEFDKMKEEWSDCNSVVQGMFLNIEKELIGK